MLKNIPISVLDLVSVSEGQTTTQAFERSRRLAILAEQLGYKRFWVAEHHNSRSIASSATSVVMSYLASATKEIESVPVELCYFQPCTINYCRAIWNT